MHLTNYIKASEKIFNQLSSSISIIDLESNILSANNNMIKSLGFKSLHETQGRSYSDMRCEASNQADIFKANDKLIFSKRKKFSFLRYQHYADGWKLLISEKSLLLNDNQESIGLISYWTDITDSTLIDISRFINMQKKFKKMHDKQFSYLLENENFNSYQLSQRQLECLFFLIRGKSDKDIAQRLQLSARTVESYINEIKFKMYCSTRAQIIEKSFAEGLVNTVPMSLLKTFIV